MTKLLEVRRDLRLGRLQMEHSSEASLHVLSRLGGLISLGTLTS